MSSGASTTGAPPDPRRQAALLVAPVRFGLGAAGLIAAVAIDVSLGTALAEAALGAGLTIFALVAPGGRRKPAQLRPHAVTPTPQPWWRALAEAMFPSTYGVALLTGIALAFNRDLAAFLAGILLGMGAAGLIYGLRARSSPPPMV